MNLNRIVLLLGLLCLAGICYGQRQVLSIEESQLNWTGKAAAGTYQLNGTMTATEGELQVKAGSIEEAKVVMDVGSMASETPGLCEHLRKKDFFHVRKHPKATFELVQACPLVEGAGLAKGWLTIRGKRKLIQVPVKVRFNENALELKATLAVDRTEYGIRYNSSSFFENLGNEAIADEIEMEVRLVFRGE